MDKLRLSVLYLITVPLFMEASRKAENESPGNDFNKRLMIVPRCHVIKLHLDNLKRENHIQTNLSNIEVLPNSIVIIALGTIESTRLALLSFPNKNELIGKNLMAHLRSNLYIRILREAVLSLDPNVKNCRLQRCSQRNDTPTLIEPSDTFTC